MASSKLRTTQARSSTNFIPLSTNAHREFLFKFIPDVGYEKTKFTFIPIYRRDRVVSIRYLFTQSNGRSFGIDLDVTEDKEENSSLADILNRIENVKFDRNHGFSGTDEFKDIINSTRVSKSNS